MTMSCTETCVGVRSVEITSGSTKIKLVYGADPRVNDKTISVDTVYTFDGGVMTNTGVMIMVSLDVGFDLTWDSGLSLCLCLYDKHWSDDHGVS